jgi:2-iminobutanoate/2-iminopropanoate deaminase
MRQALVGIIVCATLLGCGHSREQLRTIVAEEIGASFGRRYFTSDTVIGPYTPAINAGPFLFVSGQIGLNPQTMELVADDLESQTRQTLANLSALLKQAGYDSSNVIQCTVYIRDMKEFSKMNAIYGAFFSAGRYPTRTTVEVSNLPKNAKIEITAMAMK